MRVASMLFERGLLIRGDKIFTQELVLDGNDRVCGALESAEADGNVVPLEKALAEARGEANNAADSDEEGGANNNNYGGTRGRKDSDDHENLTALDERRESFRIPGTDGGPKLAPHPAAGGLTTAIPEGMSMSKDTFSGPILMRVSSKMMFRKWKPVFFSLDKQRLVIWNTRRDSGLGGAPRAVFRLHECMWIAKPTLKKTYSLIDDGRRVYFTTIKENTPDSIALASSSGMERPVTFTPALNTQIVAKFGSHKPQEISAFAHAVYGVMLHYQKEAKETAAAKRISRGGRG